MLVPAEQDAIAAAARSGDEDALAAVLGGLKDRPSSQHVLSEVGEVLQTTRSRRIRNTAALALADGGLAEMSGYLVAALRDEGVAGESGTLLFALGELGGNLPIDVAAHLIAKGSYEARAETLTFFEHDRIDRRDEEACRSAKATLVGLITGGDAEASEAAGLALRLLDATDG